MTAKERLRDPMTWIMGAFLVSVVIGGGWNLPCTDGWSNDELAPRTSMLAAVVETYRPGHYFRYPPLHGLILLIVQLPLLLVAVVRAGSVEASAVNHEAIKVSYMTLSMILGRLVGAAMGVGLVWHTKRLWERLGGTRVGLVAAALVALNPMVVFWTHATAVDLPSWFWATWAMLELDRVASGEPRERKALWLVAATMLTKDQTAFLVFGAALVTLVVVPLVEPRRGGRLRSILTREILVAALQAAGIYLVVSGIVINPSGFRLKLAYMTGSGNVGWTIYDRSFHGTLQQLRDIVLSLPIFGSPVLVPLAIAGVVLALRARPTSLALRRAAPLVAALTYFFLFVVPTRWTMERHIVPLSLMLFPYAGFVFDAVFKSVAAWPRRAAWSMAAVVLGTAAYDLACVDGTLMADSRDRATAFLDKLPRGTTLEVYGGNQYMAHLPTHLTLVRVGHDPVGDRRELPEVDEQVGNYGDIDRRKPNYVLVSEPVARGFNPLPGVVLTDRGRTSAQDPDAHPFFAALEAEKLHYHRVLTARCELRWPLVCRRINLSTGAETWIFRRDNDG